MADSDSRSFEIRGLMLDPARLVERHEFYFDLLDRLGNWGFNTLWWHFSDDEGFALELDSHPELATPFAFTKSEMARFVRAAEAAGIDVVPEVETLGHTRYITSLAQYAHLADGTAEHFSAACPSHPQTLELMKEILEEVADLFGSCYFHAGLDEVDFSGCPRCNCRAQGKQDWWIYAQYAKAIHEILTACGKRMIMWADHVERSAAMLETLPRDIILAHWQYTDVHPERIRPSLRAGFNVVCAPALCHWGDMIQPNAANFTNMDRMTEEAQNLSQDGCMGVVNTWWAPWRGLRDAYLPAVAYTGCISARGEPADKCAFARQFVAQEFEVQEPDAADAMWRMHELMLKHDEVAALLFVSKPAARDALRLAGAPGFAERAEHIRQCINTLGNARTRVKSHKAEYEAIYLAARLAAVCMTNGRRLLRIHGSCEQARELQEAGGPMKQVSSLLTTAADGLEAMLEDIECARDQAAGEWDRTRYHQDTRRASKTAPLDTDMLVDRLCACSRYLKKTALAFRRALARHCSGGSVPRVV